MKNSIQNVLYPCKNKGFAFILFVSTFLYLYSIQFKFIPFGSRVILALLGFIILFFQIVIKKDRNGDVQINQGVFMIGSAMIFIVIATIMSVLVNRTSDFEFLKYPISLVLIVLASYFIFFLVKKSYGFFSWHIMVNMIICAVLLQVILALLIFLSPPFNEFLNNLQSINELDKAKLEEALEFRLVGFGSRFFGSGVLNGFALMLIALRIKTEKFTRTKLLIITVGFLLIFVLGMMMARTTIIGFIMAIFFLLLPLNLKKANYRVVTGFFLNLILIPLLTVFLLSILFPTFASTLSKAASFGFEMFVNYYEGSGLQSESTNYLKDMYVWPTSIKTYIIGDGYYANPKDPESYYMFTDVGYLRLIYYFGLLGTLAYFMMQATVILQAMKKKTRALKFFLLLAFLYCLVLNFKGFTDIFFLVILFCYSNSRQYEQLNRHLIVY